jgi:solute carrier family 32 (vesicular inhibitory amino acid transporter)
MSPSARNPTTWDEYEGRASPTGSLASNALTEDNALLDDAGGDEDGEARPHLERRR